MWLATALFSLRVVGQAVQRWFPLPSLPPFSAWQGSATPYPLLFAIQIAIVAVMAHVSHRAWTGSTWSRRAMQWAKWAGAVYMIAAVARIAIGLFVDDAPAWFRAWISGVFHVVLAGFGRSGQKSLEELLVAGTDIGRIVVIDPEHILLDPVLERLLLFRGRAGLFLGWH